MWRSWDERAWERTPIIFKPVMIVVIGIWYVVAMLTYWGSVLIGYYVCEDCKEVKNVMKEPLYKRKRRHEKTRIVCKSCQKEWDDSQQRLFELAFEEGRVDVYGNPIRWD